MRKDVVVILSVISIFIFLLFFYNSFDIKLNKIITGNSIADLFESFRDDTSLSPENGGEGSPDALVTLGLDEIFINNTNSLAISNQLASVPITFQENEATDANIFQFILRDGSGTNLPSQIQPTSYYPKSGSIRTAVAHVKVSLNPGQEVIYRIVRDPSWTSPAFQFHSSVNTFLQSGQVKAVSRDVNQAPYQVTFDISQARLVLDGPLIKIYEYHKAHRPIGSADLTHLGSSVFYVTFVSNEPLARVQHLWVNTHNLEELTRVRDANNEWVYSEGQNGHMKYHDLNLYINTTAGNSMSGFLEDRQYIFPTSISQETNAVAVSIMPSNGQELLGTDIRSMNRCSSGCQFNPGNYTCSRVSGTGSCSLIERGGYTNPQSPPKNYIGTGQGLGTEVVVYFSNRVGTNSNYFVENGIYSGQSLGRYSLVDSPIYSELPDPESLGSKNGYLGHAIWNFALDANEELNGGNLYSSDIGSTIPLMNSNPYRFGEGGTGRREMGSAGEGETVNTIQTLYVKYMLSCFERCEKKYLDAMRYMSISIPYIPHHLVGFNPENHTEASIAPYRTRPFSISSQVNPAEDGTFCGLARITIQRTGQPFTPKDFLGYCDQVNNSQPHALNYPVGIYGLSRQWTGWDDAHFGPNRLANYYESTGDLMVLHLYKDITDTWASVFHNVGSLGGIRGQQRGQGRAMVAISELYRITKNPYYKRTLEFQPSLIELYTLNRNAIGSRGTNPVTGDPFPVGFMGTKNDPAAINRHASGNTNVGVAWEDAIVDEGLYNIYADITDDQLVLSTIERIFDHQLTYLFQYAYKEPTEVRNGVSLTHSLSGQNVPVAEGSGTFTQWTVVGPASGFPLQNFNDYTRFYHTDRFFYWMQYSMCAMIRDYSQDPTLKQKLKRAFESAYVYYLGGGDASQDWADRGLNLGKFEGYQLCSLTYLMNISTATGQGSVCTDNDGDGWSNCLGDCNDNDININPNIIERGALCSDSLDNNCNTLRDCNDAQCSNPTFSSSACVGIAYCGNLISESSIGEQCDVNPLNTVGANSCSEGRCVPSYAYAPGLNCLCSLGVAPPTVRNPIPLGRVMLTNPTTIGVGTNVESVCKFDIRPNIDYSSMQNTFSTTGGLTHSHQLSGLIEGAHTYHVRCQGVSNNLVNIQDFLLRFTLDGTAPRVTNPVPANDSTIPNTNSLSIQTNVNDEYPMDLEVYLKKPNEQGFNLILQESLPAGSNIRTYTELPQRINLEPTLNAFYDFEGNTNDKSGRNNNPVTIQGSSTQGIFGTGRYFDGSQKQIISLGNIASNTASNAGLLQFTAGRELTLEGWIKPDLTQPGINNSPGGIPNVYLFGKKGDNQGYGLRLIQQGGNYFLRGIVGYPNSLGGQTRTVTSSGSITLNQWHHVALVLKSTSGTSGNITIYLDGQEAGNAPWVESASGLNNNRLTHTNSWSFTMGSPSRTPSSNESGGSFTGIVDEVLVYNRSLNALEIQAHASPLVSWPQGRYDWEVRADDSIFSVVKNYHFFMQSSGGGDPAPILSSLNPSTTTTLPQTVQLIGSNFVPGATVLFNGQSLPSSIVSSFVTSSRIDITIPSNYPLGIYQIKVRNLDFQTSSAQSLTLQSSTLGMPSCTISSWQTTSSLSGFSTQGAHDSAATAYNNYIYISGGQWGTVRPNNQIYRASINSDGSLGTWNLLTTMPEGLQDHKMVINRNPSGTGATIYLIGGLADRGSGEVAINNVYYAPVLGDGTIGNWIAGPRLDFTTHGHDIAITNNKMYKYGGGSGGAGINIVEYVTINNDGSLTGDGSNSWIRGPTQNLPVSRAYYLAGGPYPEWDVAGTGIVANKVYAIGGEDDSMCVPTTTPPINTNLNSVFVATPQSNGEITSWSTTTSLPEGRFDHSANFVKDSIIVVGGMNRPLHTSNTCAFQDATAKDSVFIARLDQNGNIVRWYNGSNLPSPRGDHTSVIYNNNIYVLGGRSTNLNGPYPSQVWYASLNCVPQSSGTGTPLSFSLSRNPISGSVQRGNSVSTTVTATYT
ncbi:MAG: LamG-like jellyroll fold domain-containing protein, partial [Nanoarchaeota archaeon]